MHEYRTKKICLGGIRTRIFAKTLKVKANAIPLRHASITTNSINNSYIVLQTDFERRKNENGKKFLKTNLAQERLN